MFDMTNIHTYSWTIVNGYSEIPRKPQYIFIELHNKIAHEIRRPYGSSVR